MLHVGGLATTADLTVVKNTIPTVNDIYGKIRLKTYLLH